MTGLNTCLCGNLGDNGGFVTESAKCLGQKDTADVEAVYSTMEAGVHLLKNAAGR